MISPFLQRDAPEIEVGGDVVDASNTGTVAADVAQACLDDVRHDVKRLVHGGAHRPPEIVQSPASDRFGFRRQDSGVKLSLGSAPILPATGAVAEHEIGVIFGVALDGRVAAAIAAQQRPRVCVPEVLPDEERGASCRCEKADLQVRCEKADLKVGLYVGRKHP